MTARTTGLNVFRTAKPVTSHCRGPLHPMTEADKHFWEWREGKKPRAEWYGKK
jgi:hypothetical protein